MGSLRFFVFLMASAAGHAALLVPLSEYMPALLDARKLEADTVMVSITVVGRSELSNHARSDAGEPYQPLEHPVLPMQPDGRQVEWHRSKSPAAAASSVPAASATVAAGAAAVAERELLKKQPRTPTTIKTGSTTQPPGSLPRADAGSNRPSAEAEATRRQQVVAEERYLTDLLNAIATHRFYPANARKKGQQGRVEINLTILRNGEFASIAVSKPSNYRILNKASTRTLNRLKRFKPFPLDIDRDSWQISIPFRYVLNAQEGNRS